jgi:hypothetical protein
MTRFSREYTGKFSRLGSIDYVYRPMVMIEILGVEQSRKFEALVDSGTEITVMDRQIADLLGIQEAAGRKAKVGGIGGIELEGFIHNISFKVEGFGDIFTFGVFFLNKPSDNFEIVLGQNDFFRNFKITFERGKGTSGVYSLEH